VFFYANPENDHWVVVSADLFDGAMRTGLIIVYDPLFRALGRYAKPLREFFAVIGALQGSPLANIDWLNAGVQYGLSINQVGSTDCGLIVLDNMTRVASGTELDPPSDETPLDRRYRWFAATADLVEHSTQCSVGSINAQGEEPADQIAHHGTAVQEMLNVWSIPHWQHMIVEAQPILRNDLDGQRQQLMRIMPAILRDEPALSPITQVEMPDGPPGGLHGHVPYASLGLNDHDVALAHPRPSRIPDAVWVVVRNSRGLNKTASDKQHITGQQIGQDWIDTYHPGLGFNVICVQLSSQQPFLGLPTEPNQGISAHSITKHTRNETARFAQAMDLLQTAPTVESGHSRRLVNVIQANFDGTTTDCVTFSMPGQRWPDLDFHLSTFSSKPLRDRQPFDSTWTPNHDNTHSWAHHDMQELVTRALAANFNGLGPWQDSHNQMVYLMGRVGQYKLDMSNGAHWPIEKSLSGTYTRTFIQSTLGPMFVTQSNKQYIAVKKSLPVKKSLLPVKKSSVKKSPVKKSSVKESPVNKESPVKKSPVKKSPVKKSPVEKGPTKIEIKQAEWIAKWSHKMEPGWVPSLKSTLPLPILPAMSPLVAAADAPSPSKKQRVEAPPADKDVEEMWYPLSSTVSPPRNQYFGLREN
jgi:hypothetical protein